MRIRTLGVSFSPGLAIRSPKVTAADHGFIVVQKTSLKYSGGGCDQSSFGCLACCSWVILAPPAAILCSHCLTRRESNQQHSAFLNSGTQGPASGRSTIAAFAQP